MISDQPYISVIVSLYYSIFTLRKCLSALQSQTFRNFEIILINSSQETETEEVVREFPLNLHFIQTNKRLLPHAARNVGLKIARGELIVFTDPDCIPAKNWLEILWELYKKEMAIIVGSMDHQYRQKLASGIHLCKFHKYLPGLRPGDRWIAPTSNAAYSKAILKDLGPFDESIFAGDALLSWKACKQKLKINFQPRAKVTHMHLNSWPSFLRQRFHRGTEFAKTRIFFESWSFVRTSLTMLLFPCLTLLVMFRAWNDCRNAGMGTYFWMTIHIQLAGHFFWSLGEAKGQWEMLTNTILVRGKV